MKPADPIPAAEIVHLAERVEYAAGSVVSRALVQKAVGSITLFAFDAGQGLNEHTAPYDAYVQVLDGEGELVVGGKHLAVKAGDTVLMPANVPHAEPICWRVIWAIEGQIRQKVTRESGGTHEDLEAYVQKSRCSL